MRRHSRTLTLALIPWTCLLLCTVNPSRAQSTLAVDAMVDELFSELAKRYGYNRLRSPDADDLIGHAFYVERADLRCASDLVPMAREGRALQVTKLLDLRSAPGLPLASPIQQWTSILVSEFITQGVAARLAARMPERSAEIATTAKALRDTRAQVLVAARSVPLLPYRKAAQTALEANGLSRASDIEEGAAGVVVPVAELVVQKFEFDRSSLRAGDVSLSARLLDMFGVRLAGEASTNLRSEFQLATNSVLAVKPASLLFETAGCVPAR